MSPTEHRLAMTRARHRRRPALRALVRRRRRRRPLVHGGPAGAAQAGASSGTELAFIGGMDILHELHRWREPLRILELARLIVISRPGLGRGSTRRMSTRGSRVPAAGSRCWRRPASRSRRRSCASASPRAARSATWCRTRWRRTSRSTACTERGARGERREARRRGEGQAPGCRRLPLFRSDNARGALVPRPSMLAPGLRGLERHRVVVVELAALHLRGRTSS